MITILGPTASGKTSLAAALASEIGAEIISADSRQVYRGMDIGTGKDLDDYVVDGRPIPYHLIDIAQPGEKYNVYRYQKDFIRAYNDIRQRNREVVLCGGTGLYIEAVLKGYRLAAVGENKELRASLEGKSLDELTVILEDLKTKNGQRMHNRTDVDTAQRAIRAIEIEDYYLRHPEVSDDEESMPEIDNIIIGVNIDRDNRRKKITNRLRQRLAEGMVDEIRSLIDAGTAPEDLIYYGLEYKYVTEYVIGRLSYEEMFTQLEIAIHQFAKRQMTWFRGMQRRGFEIHWIDALDSMDKKINEILKLWQ